MVIVAVYRSALVADAVAVLIDAVTDRIVNRRLDDERIREGRLSREIDVELRADPARRDWNDAGNHAAHVAAAGAGELSDVIHGERRNRHWLVERDADRTKRWVGGGGGRRAENAPGRRS